MTKDRKDRDDHPVLDASAFDKLRRELDGDDEALQRFIRMYLKLLPKRLAQVGRAASRHNLPALVDQLQNLEVTSRMLGAERLANSSNALFAGLSSGTFPTAEEVDALKEEAAPIVEALERYLRDTPSRRSGR